MNKEVLRTIAEEELRLACGGACVADHCGSKNPKGCRGDVDVNPPAGRPYPEAMA